MHMHLLSHAWIHALGTGAWWTLFMLNVHAFWSIGVSIALTEGLFPSRARAPWLGKFGLSVAAVLFAFGIVYSTSYTFHHDPFRASTAQFIVSALFVVVFAIAAFLIPPASRDQTNSTREPLPAPPAFITGIAAFLLGAAIFLSPILWKWNWAAPAFMLAVDLVFLVGLGLFSYRSAWTPLHTLSIGAGGALLYGAHAFMQGPIVPCTKGIALASHVLFLVFALAVVALGVRRTHSALLKGTRQPAPEHSEA
jgi:hypothetical protein